MPNYGDTLTPPQYRNLVINPGGESTYSATWTASNGNVKTGTTGVTPKSGTGSAKYTVTNKSSLPYCFGPFGPEADVHKNYFKISSKGQVSFRVSLRAPQNVWVRLQARWLTKKTKDGVTTLVESDRRNLTPITKLDAGASWQTLLASTNNAIPDGVTHWQPVIAVYGSGGDNPDAPALDTVVYADEAMVPDSGVALAGVPFVIGGQTSMIWEGDQNHSSSRTVSVVTNPPVTPPPTEPPPSVDPEPDPDAPDDPDDPAGEIADGEPPYEEGESTEDPPPLPSDTVDPGTPIPDVEGGPGSNTGSQGTPDGTGDESDVAMDPGYKAGSVVVLAEDNLTFRDSSEHLRLQRDFQISNLMLNTVDSQGVAWIVSDADGWWTMPEPDVPDQPRSWFDGSFETRGRHTARTFTLTGTIIPRQNSQVAVARNRLIRAINLVHRGDWFMTHEDPKAFTKTKGSKVWLVGAPLIQTINSSGRTDFSAVFRAPDPVKYGIKDGIPPGYQSLVMTTGESDFPDREYPRTYPWAYPEAVFGSTDTIAINEGNVVVFPILKMKGPTNGPVRVINASTKQTFRITRQLFPGEELVIDCFTKQVTMNGVGNFRFYLDIDVDWLMLQPGENKLYFTEESLGGIRTDLEVLWRSGWIG